MKPDAAPQGESAGPVRVRFQVQFRRGPKGRRRAREAEPAREEAHPASRTAEEDSPPRPKPVPTASIPKITRMLVLGHHLERMVREGKVKNYAEIARLTGLSRARVTQIVNLTLLAPEIQEHILFPGNGHGPHHEDGVRRVSNVADWFEQRRRCT